MCKQTITLLLISYCIMVNPLNSQDLSQYRWTNRVIVICGDLNSSDYQLQMERLTQSQIAQEIHDRKLIILNTQTQCPPINEFSLQLFGLDGGLKLSSDDPVKAEELFDLIDSMPMRRAEVKRKLD